MILLDTNVISELAKTAPHPAVLSYMEGLASDTVFTATICEAEIRHGLARLPASRRHDELSARMNLFFEAAFPDQVLRFDRACATHCGDIRHAREAAGRPIAMGDAMIAATARAYGARALVTRNIRDFEGCGVALVDPWSDFY